MAERCSARWHGSIVAAPPRALRVSRLLLLPAMSCIGLARAVAPKLVASQGPGAVSVLGAVLPLGNGALMDMASVLKSAFSPQRQVGFL